MKIIAGGNPAKREPPPEIKAIFITDPEGVAEIPRILCDPFRVEEKNTLEPGAAVPLGGTLPPANV